MKKNTYRFVGIVVCIIMMMWGFVGCGTASTTNNQTEESMKKYYLKEDFQSITIGESTFRDVYSIATIELCQLTSYGACCEYPMQNGGVVRITFYGKDLIVGAIEEVAPLTSNS